MSISIVKVEVAHPGAHEPAAETFADDFSKGLTESLREAGLKRGGEGDPKIVGYAQTSGVSTVYDVELDTEPRSDASAKPSKRAAARKAAHEQASEGESVDVVTTEDVAEKGTTASDVATPTV